MTEPAFQESMALSSDAFPAPERFEMWREFFGRNILRIDAATPDKLAFHAKMKVRPLPGGVNVTHTEITPCSFSRTKELLADGDDGVCFCICLDGWGDWLSGNRSLTLEAGGAVLVSNWMLGHFRCEQSHKAICIGFDRDTMREIVPSADDLLMRPLAPSNEAVALLTAYCRELLGRSGALAPGLGQIASRQIRELAAYALAPQSELARSAPFGGIKAARLRAVLDDIAGHLADSSLSAATVADRLGVTARHVNRLMEGTGLSFSRYVLELRLDEARRRLGDASAQRLRIGDIVYATGFQDLSHFNRAFRRRFGDTPSAFRRLDRP